MGVFRLAVDTPVTLGMAGFEQGYAPGSFLWVVNNIYFQYYSLLIFGVSALVMVAVSYLTEAPAEREISGLTFATATEEQKRRTRESWNRWDVLASAAVLLLILLAYLYFNG
jgi:SSS family solute:Na+ symporter